MFRWFESRLDPYPAQAPQMPPRGLWRFMLHFTQGAHGYMLAMAACSALIAVAPRREKLGLLISDAFGILRAEGHWQLRAAIDSLQAHRSRRSDGHGSRRGQRMRRHWRSRSASGSGPDAPWQTGPRSA
ncbi:hypothetical protein DPM13_09500 [Paracoccus mutanolyticus]|uniref:Uncharacterized protein n=1 Tax=Paracoccus mutanolyticus TaxID=1499308 RepID=A0ABM6WRK4_9RHOB|nr:hypothetical protein DPM13_09500 [Paracoccus mutanolyticus]